MELGRDINRWRYLHTAVALGPQHLLALLGHAVVGPLEQVDDGLLRVQAVRLGVGAAGT